MEVIEVEAKIINIYPLDEKAVLIVFATPENWVLRGVAKATLAQIERLAGKPVRIAYRHWENRELGSIAQIEVLENDASESNHW